MISYTVLSDKTSRETHPKTGLPVIHRTWVVLVSGVFYYLSWLSCAPDHELPECMAFPCDETGHVDEWRSLACCYCVNPHVAFAEVMDQLLGIEVA